MPIRVQKWCLWSAPLALFVFGLGFVVIGRMLPPPSPNLDAAGVVAFYNDNTNGLRLGLALSMVAGALTGPFVSVITLQMRRIEGPVSPLAFTQFGMGMLGVLLIALPVMVIEAAAFRPDRDPDALLAIHDIGWIMLIGTYGCVFVQCIVVGVCILLDREAEVWPRWLGYFSIWVGLMFLPGSLLYFFTTGPFAWDGIFVWWIPFTVFFGWIVVMFVMTLKALNRQAAIPGAGSTARSESSRFRPGFGAANEGDDARAVGVGSQPVANRGEAQ
jgi:hypothetical protein